MSIASVVSELLPSKLAKSIALATWPTALGLASVPAWLAPALPAMSPATQLLLQVALFFGVALAGMMLTLAAILHHHANKPAKWATERYAKLPPHHRVLLALSSLNGATPLKISSEALMSLHTVNHWIGVYRKSGLIEPDDPLRLTEKGILDSVNL